LSLRESMTIPNTCACYDKYGDQGAAAGFHDARANRGIKQ
jgi:hypothetical protein